MERIIFKYSVSLVVTDFSEEPNHISRILALEPTRVWLAGEPVTERAKNTHKQNGWKYAVQPSAGDSGLAPLLEALKETALPRLERFAQLPDGAEVCVQCIARSTTGTPPIFLSAEQMRVFAAIKARFDVDLYLLPVA